MECAWQLARFPNFFIASSASGFVVAEIDNARRISLTCRRGLLLPKLLTFSFAIGSINEGDNRLIFLYWN